MSLYRRLRPLLFRLEAEQAHTVGSLLARLAQGVAPSLLESRYGFEDDRLTVRRWGRTFPNPIGLAAGFDKNARQVRFWEAVGCGFVEVGSVSAQPAGGNPKPRAFRLPEDRALINRMGLNNDGAEAVARRLKKTAGKRTRPLGVNIAKTPDPDVLGAAAREDFRTSFRDLAPRADYVTLNVSCPNTEDGTTFEEPEALDDLLDTIADERAALEAPPPVLVKLSPPYSDRVVLDTRLDDIIAVARAHDVDGFVASNTASDRFNLQTPSDRLAAIGDGGLSGPPIADRATHLVRYLYRATDGQLPIIGVGGVCDAASAYKKICAGASLVQLYTALVYEGPALIRRIKEGLLDRLREDGHVSVEAAVGSKVSLPLEGERVD